MHNLNLIHIISFQVHESNIFYEFNVYQVLFCKRQYKLYCYLNDRFAVNLTYGFVDTKVR